MLRRFGPPALIAAGALLVVGALSGSALAARIARPAALPVPPALAGQPLTQQAGGPDAVAEVARLHGKEFPLTSGAMAMYGEGAATLWVSGVPLRWTAAQMVRAMTDKIAEGRSPFTPTGTRASGGRTVYQLDGMGQKHFYFQSAALVVWLAADPQIAEQALNETLEFYP